MDFVINEAFGHAFVFYLTARQHWSRFDRNLEIYPLQAPSKSPSRTAALSWLEAGRDGVRKSVLIISFAIAGISCSQWWKPNPITRNRPMACNRRKTMLKSSDSNLRT